MGRRRTSRQGIHPDTKNQWLRNIRLQGGTISPISLKIGNRFIVGCQRDGIWRGKLDQGLVMPFLGSDLNAAIAPMITPRFSATNTPVTNVNFVSSDWSESTGLNPGTSNSTKYLKCGFNPSLDASVTSAHCSCYSRTSGALNSSDIGCFISSGARLAVTIAYGDTSYFQCFSDGAGNGFPGGQITTGSANANATRLYTASRISNSDFQGYRQDVSLSLNSNTTTGSPPNAEFLAFGSGNGSPSFWGYRVLSHVSAGVGLTQTEMTLYSNRVTEKETALGRNV